MSEIGFGEGDIVQLRSGGPLMTVLKAHPPVDSKPAIMGSDPQTKAPVEIVPGCAAVPARLTVVWFTTAHEVRSGDFAIGLLEKRPDPRRQYHDDTVGR